MVNDLEACAIWHATLMGCNVLPVVMAVSAQSAYTADGAQVSRLGGDLVDAILRHAIPR